MQLQPGAHAALQSSQHRNQVAAAARPQAHRAAAQAGAASPRCGPSITGRQLAGKFGWHPVGAGLGNRLDVICGAHSQIPEARGLFDPANDKDSCGVGFVGELSKAPSRKCVTDALQMLIRMTHRGACGCEVNTGASARVIGREARLAAAPAPVPPTPLGERPVSGARPRRGLGAPPPARPARR